MEIPYANEDMEGVRQVALGHLKEKDKKIAELESKFKILKNNGIWVDKGVVCLGIKFNFDFTCIQKLNRHYADTIEVLEKKLEMRK